MKHLLIIACTGFFSFVYSQNTDHEELFKLFGEIPQQMSSEELTAHGQTAGKIPEKFYSYLGFNSLSGSYMVPIGKVEKGNKVIILYMEVAGKEAYNSGKVAIAYKSIEKKNGEIYMSSHHLLDVGLAGDSKYKGKFEREGSDDIIFHQISSEAQRE